MYLRLLLGLVLMAAACWFAYRRGDRTVRRAAKVIAVCWTLSLAAQLVTGHTVEPAIGADIVCGLFMLRLAWTDARGWIWAIIGIESVLFVTHALLYRSQQPPTGPQILANNALVTLALIVLALAALRHPRETETQA
jgi:peptidoglycan/LPS O-acetylase OafA/YrhL